MRHIFHSKHTGKWHAFAPFLLRLVVGLVFLVHGWDKLTNIGIDNVAAFFGGVGIPAAGFFAAVVTWLEILGGLALILGAWTHWAAKLLTIEMIVAIFTVHLDGGFLVGNGGVEFILLILAALISIMITGPGQWALGKK